MGHPLLDLTNKTAVVIGGTSGIGLALARGLAQAGANVVPTGRRAELVRKSAAEMEALGRRSLVETCDVTDNSSIERLLQAVSAEFGSVQILVNCAGRTKKMPTLDFPESDWDAIFETNLKETLRACRIFGRHMIERRYGRIINIASLSSLVGLFEVAAYGAGTAGVASLTKTPADRKKNASAQQLPFAAALAVIRARASFTTARNFLAFSTIASGLPARSASDCTNSPPTPSAAAPASTNSAAVWRLTPPVGTSGTCGSGPRKALMYFAPPSWPQGKTFTKSEPASQAVITSVGVSAPAIMSFPSATARWITCRLSPGLTRNCAPASRHRLAASALRTVPAPTRTSAGLLLASSRITSTAPGTVMVISTIGIPPSQTASDAMRASHADDARTTGTTPDPALPKIRIRGPKQTNRRRPRDRKSRGSLDSSPDRISLRKNKWHPNHSLSRFWPS